MFQVLKNPAMEKYFSGIVKDIGEEVDRCLTHKKIICEIMLGETCNEEKLSKLRKSIIQHNSYKKCKPSEQSDRSSVFKDMEIND